MIQPTSSKGPEKPKSFDAKMELEALAREMPPRKSIDGLVASLEKKFNPELKAAEQSKQVSEYEKEDAEVVLKTREILLDAAEQIQKQNLDRRAA